MEKKIKIAGIGQGYEQEPMALAFARMKPIFSTPTLLDGVSSQQRLTKKIPQVTQSLSYSSVYSITFEPLAYNRAVGEDFVVYQGLKVKEIENRI